jgi:hypothetical protein
VTALKRGRRIKAKNHDKRSPEELALDTEERLQQEILSQNIGMVIAAENNSLDASPSLSRKTEAPPKGKRNEPYSSKKDEGLRRFWQRRGARRS